MAVAWLLLAARTAAIGIERVLLKELGRDAPAAAATFWFFAFGFMALAPWGLTHPLPAAARLGAMLSGVLFAAAYACFVRALATGEISRVTPLSGLSHVFLLGIVTGLGRERVGAAQALGTLLILSGVAALQGGGLLALPRLAREPAGRLMVLYCLLLAGERVVDQAGGPLAHPFAYAWTMFGVVAVALAAWLSAFRRWPAALDLLVARLPVALAAATTNVITYTGLVALFDDFPVTVMEPATSLSYLVSAWLGARIYGEDLRGRILPALVIAAGSGFVLWR